MYSGSAYGTYGSNSLYGGGLNAGVYGSSMYSGGGLNGSGYGYGGGMYGSGGMFGGQGSGMYGGYGGGMYGRPYGGLSGGMYAPGGGMAPPGFDPAHPPAPPTAWQAALGALGGVVHFFGRLSFLVDENAHAVHFFISALLQMLDRAGSLYGELARFILRVVFRRKRPMKALPRAPGHGNFGAPGFPGAAAGMAAAVGGPWHAPPALPPPGSGGPLDVPAGHWDALWGDE